MKHLQGLLQAGQQPVPMGRTTKVTPERPHDLNYSLTLHAPNGSRLVGFDNAHPVRTRRGPSGGQRAQHDHRHRLSTTRTYEYEDAATDSGNRRTRLVAILVARQLRTGLRGRSVEAGFKARRGYRELLGPRRTAKPTTQRPASNGSSGQQQTQSRCRCGARLRAVAVPAGSGGA